MSASKDLVWITPKWPLPVDDGARQCTVHLVTPLTESGIRVHLCAIVPRDEGIDTEAARRELGVTSVRVVRRAPSSKPGHLKNLVTRPLVPITFAPYSTRSVARQVKKVLREHPDATVVFDGLHAGAWTLQGYTDHPTVYRAHNVERDIWLRGADKADGKARRALLTAQGHLVGRFERRVSRTVRTVLPVSDDDATIFRSWHLSGPVTTVPIGMPVPEAAPIPEGPLDLLFVGRLDWPPNREGLEWMLKEVWPEVIRRAPDRRLTVVGSGDGSWLKPYTDLKGIELLGRVPELEPYYRRCAAALVPVFYGSGTRVKAIEASLFGRVCVSTRLGVEGTGLKPGQHFAHGETAAEWIDLLTGLSREQAQQMGDAARQLARERFDRGVIAARAAEALAELGLVTARA